MVYRTEDITNKGQLRDVLGKMKEMYTYAGDLETVFVMGTELYEIMGEHNAFGEKYFNGIRVVQFGQMEPQEIQLTYTI